MSPMVFDLTSFSHGEPGDEVCRMVSMCMSTASCFPQYRDVNTSASCCTPLECMVEHVDVGVDDGNFDLPPVDLDVMDLTASCSLPNMQATMSPDVSHESQCVRMVQVSTIPENAVEIVINSGSDASVLPQQFAECGESYQDAWKSMLFDAQGNIISVSDERSVEIALEGESEEGVIPVCFKEKCHVGGVSGPLLCYGHLLNANWLITKYDCVHERQLAGGLWYNTQCFCCRCARILPVRVDGLKRMAT